jgi:starch synthase (maltosyl-transferring)
VDGGRFPIKRVPGETVVVECDAFADGHDAVACVLLYKKEGGAAWSERDMTPMGNDRWRGAFTVEELGRHVYSLEAWIDPFRTWQRDLSKRIQARQDIRVDILIGAALVEAAASRSAGEDRAALSRWAAELRQTGSGTSAVRDLLLDEACVAAIERHPGREFSTRYARELAVRVDRKKARFSAWYEMFPRSCAAEPGAHGTLADCQARLPYVSSMGFDVLYLPPIHPIGRTNRKGPNNATEAGPDAVGSPWAIGGEAGGHKAIHPQLGSLADFQNLLAAAKDHGLEVAMDVAYQCSPDHPWVREHPEWFRHRPDGTIQFAENPPKKYQDIYPLDFETPAWRELWRELHGVIDYWA